MCETVSGTGISNANTLGLSGPFNVATIAARHARCLGLCVSIVALDRSVDPLAIDTRRDHDRSTSPVAIENSNTYNVCVQPCTVRLNRSEHRLTLRRFIAGREKLKSVQNVSLTSMVIISYSMARVDFFAGFTILVFCRFYDFAGKICLVTFL